MEKGGPPPRRAVVAWCLASGGTVLFGIAMATGIVQDETYNNARPRRCVYRDRGCRPCLASLHAQTVAKVSGVVHHVFTLTSPTSGTPRERPYGTLRAVRAAQTSRSPSSSTVPCANGRPTAQSTTRTSLRDRAALSRHCVTRPTCSGCSLAGVKPTVSGAGRHSQRAVQDLPKPLRMPGRVAARPGRSHLGSE